MRTFEQIVDGLWKPERKVFNYTKYKVDSKGVHLESKWCNKHAVSWILEDSDKYNFTYHINLDYKYAQDIMKPFYGRDIGEPIIKICKRILDCPDRFVMAKEGDVTEVYSGRNHKKLNGVEVLQDKDVQSGKFVFHVGSTVFPTFLTKDESKLLYTVAQEWYKSQKDEIDRKKQLREQQKNDKFRQELMNDYKGV